MKNFELLSREVIYRGKVFDVEIDVIKYNSGNDAIRQVARHPGGAVIVPVLPNGNYIMIRQFRYPLDKVIVEFPAGKLEPGEDPLLCASRELTEETGYSAASVVALGPIATTPGFCDEILYIFLAEGLTPGLHHREEGEEGMEIFEATPDDINRMIISGEFYDSKSITAFTMAQLKRNNTR